MWLTELAVRREVEGLGGGGGAVPEVVWLTELLPSPFALQLLAHPLLRVALLGLREVLQASPDELLHRGLQVVVHVPQRRAAVAFD